MLHIFTMLCLIAEKNSIRMFWLEPDIRGMPKKLNTLKITTHIQNFRPFLTQIFPCLMEKGCCT
jgi:hypothetical protein